MKRFVLEMLATLAVVICLVAVCDHRRVFAQEEDNNHTGKAWHYLYRYAEPDSGGIDVMILGNSHAYTGILPDLMTETLHKRSFILAAQGVYITDCYYMLEEALTVVHPQLLVIETYTLADYKQKELTGISLNSQFQSFENRKNVWLKLKSTPALFSLENAPFAWSRTLRNHSYLFDNTLLVLYNLKNPHPPVYENEEYLGRFVSFTSGLTQATLDRYDKEGPPVDGNDMTVGKEAEQALAKIRALCEKKGIRVMFLTVPMYHLHIQHRSGLEKNLATHIGDTPWLDLQYPGYDKIFTEDCFEDTYSPNQHQTVRGAYFTTSYLNAFIQQNNLL